MEFEASKVEAFINLFSDSSTLIRAFPGVGKLELHRDASAENVFYTLSEWESESHLEMYRNSELFKSVWTRTKEMFSSQPQAFSLVQKLTIL